VRSHVKLQRFSHCSPILLIRCADALRSADQLRIICLARLFHWAFEEETLTSFDRPKVVYIPGKLKFEQTGQPSRGSLFAIIREQFLEISAQERSALMSEAPPKKTNPSSGLTPGHTTQTETSPYAGQGPAEGEYYTS
jgi:hypothetical protein